MLQGVLLPSLVRGLAAEAIVLCSCLTASAATVEVTVQGGDQALENVPIRVVTEVPLDQADLQTIMLKDDSG